MKKMPLFIFEYFSFCETAVVQIWPFQIFGPDNPAGYFNGQIGQTSTNFPPSQQEKTVLTTSLKQFGICLM